MEYVVCKGEYPFTDEIGVVSAPKDRPDIALTKAIQEFYYVDTHPVVHPISVN